MAWVLGTLEWLQVETFLSKSWEILCARFFHSTLSHLVPCCWKMFCNISTPNLPSLLFHCSRVVSCHWYDQWQFLQLLVQKASTNYWASLKSFVESLAGSYLLLHRDVSHPICSGTKRAYSLHPNSRLSTHSSRKIKQSTWHRCLKSFLYTHATFSPLNFVNSFLRCQIAFPLPYWPHSSVLWKTAAVSLSNLSTLLNLQF